MAPDRWTGLPDEIVTEDYHTGGEPFRIVVDPPAVLAAVPAGAATVAERRVAAMASEDVQLLRKVLGHEPRGHADMYGGFLVPPDDEGADLGVLFWHKDGFSTACGHGTIALGAWAVESGRIAAPVNGSRDVVIDVPSGRVTAQVHMQEGRVASVSFVNVTSWVHGRGEHVETSRGAVRCDIAFGGAMYAVVPAAALGLRVRPEDLAELVRSGREIRAALNDVAAATHPHDDRLSGIYGTIFTEDVGEDDVAAAAGVEGLGAEGALHQRNVTVFADGEVDRSPCGSGTAARVADLWEAGRLGVSEVLVHDSVVGSRFRAQVTQVVDGTSAGRPAVVVEVTGTAHRTGTSTFTVDPYDSMVPGFVLR